MLKLRVEGMQVIVESDRRGWVHCMDANTANRFHVHFDMERFANPTIRGPIYKNPPSGVERGMSRHFDTIKVSLHGEHGRILTPLFEAAIKEGLTNAINALAIKKNADKAATELARVERLQELAGPQLYKALNGLMAANTGDVADYQRRWDACEAAIKLADVG